MLCGLLTPDERRRHAASATTSCARPREIKRHVGYMTQRFSLWEDLTIRENLRFVARMYGMDEVQAAGRARARAARASPIARGQLAGRALRRLEAAAGARRLPAARAAAAAARRADRGRRPEGAARLLGRAARARARAASPCSSARTTWTRPSAATSSPTSSTAGCSRRARRARSSRASRSCTWSVEGAGSRRARGASCAACPASSRWRRSARRCTSRAPTPRASTRRSRPFKASRGRQWERVEPGLEDVFIHLMKNGEPTRRRRAGADRGAAR